MSLITSIITGGSNNHETTSTEANAVATDFMDEGVVGAITNTSGVAPATGAFAVNADSPASADVVVSAGTAWTTATPTGQSSQLLRTVNSAAIDVTIAANSSGSTKYDWVYIKIDPDNAADSDASASNVATIVTSRSTSSSTDDGTPPTYGTLLAVVTVANGFSTLANATISDRRTRASLVEAFFRGRYQSNTTNSAPTGLTIQYGWGFIQGDASTDINEAVTFPTAFSAAPFVICSALGKHTSAPTAISDLSSTTAANYAAQPNSITTTGLDVYLRLEGGATFSNTQYFGYSWIAIGAV